MIASAAKSPIVAAEAVPPRRYRAACNTCHHMKLRCSGQNPCTRCHESGYECVYKLAAKLGKPKGSKNKRTLERLRQRAESLQNSKPSQEMPVEQDLGVANNMFALSTSLSDDAISSLQMPLFQSGFPNPVDAFHGSPWQYTPASESNATSYLWDDDSCQLGDMDLIGPWTCPISPPQPFAPLHTSTSPLNMVTDDYFRNYWMTGLQIDVSNKQNQTTHQHSLSHHLDLRVSPEPTTKHTNVSTPLANARTARTPSPSSSSSTTTTCNCISKQLDSYCRLKVLDDQTSPMTPISTILASIDTLTSIQSLLQCPRCHTDQHTLFDIIITLRLILRWLLKLSQQQQPGSMGPSIYTTFPMTTTTSTITTEGTTLKLGDHEICDQEQLHVIRKTLIDLMLNKATKVLLGVRNLLHMLENSNANSDFTPEHQHNTTAATSKCTSSTTSSSSDANHGNSRGRSSSGGTGTGTVDMAASDKLDALYLHLTLTQLEANLESVRGSLTANGEMEGLEVFSALSGSSLTSGWGSSCGSEL